MKTVRIYGMAHNLTKSPPAPKGQGVWLSNSPGSYERRLPRALGEWTRWFNLHSRAHMLKAYPKGFNYYKTVSDGRPIYFQKIQPDVPASVVFPRERIQEAFKLPDGSPNRFFSCTICWLIAFAILEGFERIELWGFALRDNKANPGQCFAYERPGFFYWVQQARNRGIEVIYQKEIEKLPFKPGDPTTYTGPLYGYETKPEE